MDPTKAFYDYHNKYASYSQLRSFFCFLSLGGELFIAVSMYQPFGWSAHAEESTILPVAPRGLFVSAEGAAP